MEEGLMGRESGRHKGQPQAQDRMLSFFQLSRTHVYRLAGATNLEPPHLPCCAVQNLGADRLSLPHLAESKESEEHAGIEEQLHLQQRGLPGVEGSEVLREGVWRY